MKPKLKEPKPRRQLDLAFVFYSGYVYDNDKSQAGLRPQFLVFSSFA